MAVGDAVTGVRPGEEVSTHPLPALTAEQALGATAGQPVLLHGPDGLTGGTLVHLAAVRGLRVIAPAGPGSHDRVRARLSRRRLAGTGAAVEGRPGCGAVRAAAPWS